MKEITTETELWKQLKPSFKKIDENAHLIRMSSDTIPGIPDVYFALENNNKKYFGFIELKIGKLIKTKGIVRAAFSPAQITWKLSKSGYISHAFIYYADHILRPAEWKLEYTLKEINMIDKIEYPIQDLDKLLFIVQ